MSLTLNVLTLVLALAHQGPDKRIDYTSFEGEKLRLHPWAGEHVVLLTPSGELDASVMTTILTGLDRAWEAYAGTVGGKPRAVVANTIDGRAAIAVVSKTCGAGCARPGAHGIELMPSYFQVLYDGVRDRGEFDQVLFYELGRNFWLFGEQLEYKGPDDTGTITTGFAVYMRFLSMQIAGIDGGPFGERSFTDFRSEVQLLLQRYLDDPDWNWESSLKIGRAPENPMKLGATDLFASFLMALQKNYGGEAFVGRLWAEVSRRPAARDTQSAVDNLVIAASAAAAEDLTGLFSDRWRWPVSDAARRTIRERFAAQEARREGPLPPRGAVILCVENLDATALDDRRLSTMAGLKKLASWTERAWLDPAVEPSDGWVQALCGTGPASAGHLDAQATRSIRGEHVASLLEGEFPRARTLALTNFPALHGAILKGGVDARVSCEVGPACEEKLLKALDEHLSASLPSCAVIAWRPDTSAGAGKATSTAARDADRLLALVNAALLRRPAHGSEEWLVALCGTGVPPRAKNAGAEDLGPASLLAIQGAAFRPGSFKDTVNLADVVPTVLHHLGIVSDLPPRLEGRALQSREAPALGRNLLFNGDAEIGAAKEKGKESCGIPGWRRVEGAAVVSYGGQSLAGTEPGPSERGANFFSGGSVERSRLEQELDLTPLAAELDRGAVRFSMEGWLGGWKDQHDACEVHLEFLGERGKVLHESSIGPVGFNDRGELGREKGVPVSGMLLRRAEGRVPKGTRAARVIVTTHRTTGGNNDGYADNLALILSR